MGNLEKESKRDTRKHRREAVNGLTTASAVAEQSFVFHVRFFMDG